MSRGDQIRADKAQEAINRANTVKEKLDIAKALRESTEAENARVAGQAKSPKVTNPDGTFK